METIQLKAILLIVRRKPKWVKRTKITQKTITSSYQITSQKKKIKRTLNN